MQIEISLDTSHAPIGIDQAALKNELQAEVDKLSGHLGEDKTIEPHSVAAPAGAHGADQLIEWIIDLAKDPDNAIIYARALVFSINQIIEAAKKLQRPENSNIDDQENNEKNELKSKIKVFGKEIILPATKEAIKSFLETLNED